MGNRDQEQGAGKTGASTSMPRQHGGTPFESIRSLPCSLFPSSLFPAFQKRLQNQHRRHLVNHFPVFLPFMAGLIEDLVGLVCRQPLIPKVHGKPGELAEFRGKCLDLERPRAGFAGKAQRVAHHDADHSIASSQAGQGAKIVAGAALSFEGENRLRGQAEFVGHGHPNALRAHIETEIARLRRGLQLVFSCPPA